jgi:hypothetical protein
MRGCLGEIGGDGIGNKGDRSFRGLGKMIILGGFGSVSSFPRC